MKVVACQWDIVWENKRANHARLRQMLAGLSGGELVVLPEMFSTGFSMNVPAVSDTWSGEDRAFLEDLAREKRLWILAGVVSTGPEGKGRNQAVLIGTTGREIARYTKLHPFSPGKEAQHYLGGDGVLVADIEGVKVCPLVCYDLRFPEAFRRAVLQGAECFVVIANWPQGRVDHWETLLKARAIENQAYVVGVNRCGRDPWLAYPGRSMVIGPKGNLVAELGAEDGLLQAEIDPAEVARWRAEFAALNDMRPDLLGE